MKAKPFSRLWNIVTLHLFVPRAFASKRYGEYQALNAEGSTHQSPAKALDVDILRNLLDLRGSALARVPLGPVPLRDVGTCIELQWEAS
jgi:hypothetical protein